MLGHLRGHILTGFPWNLSGYGWGASPAILQSASLVGIYGLSLLTLWFGASLALIALVCLYPFVVTNYWLHVAIVVLMHIAPAARKTM